ncbi:MAG: hypothetical protein LBP59_06650 [Planctomycetaceae bacterium]|nr:hypothetical protein [Planctomycetaceae bacterium]
MFAYRQSAGGTPAIRRSRMLFKIAGEFISKQPMSGVNRTNIFLPFIFFSPI